MTPKKLHRSSTDKVIAGVCGGLAKYLEIDSTLIRVIFILLCFMGGSGIFLYIVLMIVIPLDTATHGNKPLDAGEIVSNATETIKSAAETVKERIHLHNRDNHSWRMFFGLIIVFVGIVVLSRNLFPGYIIFPPMKLFWPMLAILLGLFIVTRNHK